MKRLNKWKRLALLPAGVALFVFIFLVLQLSFSDRFNETTVSSLLSLPTPVEPSSPSSPNTVLEPSVVDNTGNARLVVTETGVDVASTSLYQAVKLDGDSSTATVMGMASGYDLSVYKRFVGSLRKTGYKGHIILGVAPNVQKNVLDYFERRNVTAKIMKWDNCTYRKIETDKKDIFQKTQCEANYPDIKIRWSRFPLQADWLRECDTCTGPVLTMDVRDSFFQLDPFGQGSPVVKGLQVFQEDPTQTTEHWLTRWPIKACKGIQYTKPMLCSGTTVGTREAMLKYFEVMYEEMKVWIQDEKCRFDINGDDQSIHNYLFYSGQLPFATSIVNRAGGIVNTVGKRAATIWKQNVATQQSKGISKREAEQSPLPGADGRLWIGLEMNVTNEAGLFTEADGSLSRVIHQWDRFGYTFAKWLSKQDFVQD